MTDAYLDFLVSKTRVPTPMGISDVDDIHPALFPFQRDLVTWALRRARAAIFADTGLGKTLMELAWADVVECYTGKPVLILTPLAVAHQIVADAAKFGVEDVAYAKAQADVSSRIVVTNYDRLDGFDMATFGGVALDESSIIKGFPDYRRAVPDTSQEASKVGRKELIEGIDRVALASNEKSACVTVRLSPGALVMEKQDEKRGHAIEEMAAETDGAKAFGVNGVYFAKAARVLSCDLIDLHPSVDGRPMVLLPYKQKSPMCMISPMRIPE